MPRRVTCGRPISQRAGVSFHYANEISIMIMHTRVRLGGCVELLLQRRACGTRRGLAVSRRYTMFARTPCLFSRITDRTDRLRLKSAEFEGRSVTTSSTAPLIAINSSRKTYPRRDDDSLPFLPFARGTRERLFESGKVSFWLVPPHDRKTAPFKNYYISFY